MAVLVMDTATQVLAAAVGTDGYLLGSTSLLVPRGHSRLLQPSLAYLMDSAGIQPGDLSLIGVGVGPGSYTGVRMAVSTAKAMAMALSIPLVTISTLWTMAAAAVPAFVRDGTVVCPLLYARRGRAFGALYSKLGREWTCVTPAQVLPVAEWLEKLNAAAGDGTRLIVHDFIQSYGVLDVITDAADVDALDIADIAGNMGPALFDLCLRERGQAVQGDRIHGIEPDYALRVEAEVKLEEGSGSH